MKSLPLLVILLLSNNVQAKLLDKVVAIFNSKIITLSQINRIQTNVAARKNVSPQIYSKDKYTAEELTEILINANLIREKISTIGYTVSDEQVEDQIKSTEKRLGLGRKELLNFLQNNNLSFDEYFEIIRETIELNIFSSRVIAPMISITEQQIKNTYYNKYLGNKTVSFKYHLVDYAVQGQLSSEDTKELKESIARYHASGIIPEKFKTVETNQLENLSEDGLTTDLIKTLKTTDEGAFTKPIFLNGQTHIFYLKKKDLVESEQFQQSKEKIRQELFEQAAIHMTNMWFKRESSKHFIKYNL